MTKNCEPFVPGPAFAIASRPGWSNAGPPAGTLVLERVAGAARAGAGGVAALDHEAVDHAVEDVPGYSGSVFFSRSRGSVHSRPPVASSVKFATVFGAWSGISRTVN